MLNEQLKDSFDTLYLHCKVILSLLKKCKKSFPRKFKGEQRDLFLPPTHNGSGQKWVAQKFSKIAHNTLQAFISNLFLELGRNLNPFRRR